MLDFLVEQRLEEAVSRGELYRILKNAGFIPYFKKAVAKLGR